MSATLTQPQKAKAPKRPKKVTAAVGDVEKMQMSEDDSENTPDYRSFKVLGGHLGPRTKLSHPYSYDPILQFFSGREPTGSVYSDRLSGWYESAVMREKMLKHFGNESDYYNSRSPLTIEAFLQDLMDKPTLKLTRIEEHCNQSSGFPVWFFAYREEAPKTT